MAATKQSLAERRGAKGMQLATYEPPADTNALRYDYALIDAEHRQQVVVAALDIRQRERRAVVDLIAIGQHLSSVKDVLPHGSFLHWVETEFGYSERSARDFMAIAHRFGGKSAIIADLNVTTVRMLASPSVPDEAVEDVLEFVEREGRVPKIAAVEHIIKMHKAPPKMITVRATVSAVEPATPPKSDNEGATWAHGAVTLDRDLTSEEFEDYAAAHEVVSPESFEAPTVATCRVCGCTDDRACEDGCWWVEDDLCSACATADEPTTPNELAAIAIVEAEAVEDDAERAPFARVPDAPPIDPFDGWLAAMPPDLTLRRCAAILELAKTTAKRALDIHGIERPGVPTQALYNRVYGALPAWSQLISELEKAAKRD